MLGWGIAEEDDLLPKLDRDTLSIGPGVAVDSAGRLMIIVEDDAPTVSVAGVAEAKYIVVEYRGGAGNGAGNGQGKGLRKETIQVTLKSLDKLGDDIIVGKYLPGDTPELLIAEEDDSMSPPVQMRRIIGWLSEYAVKATSFMAHTLGWGIAHPDDLCVVGAGSPPEITVQPGWAMGPDGRIMHVKSTQDVVGLEQPGIKKFIVLKPTLSGGGQAVAVTEYDAASDIVLAVYHDGNLYEYDPEYPENGSLRRCIDVGAVRMQLNDNTLATTGEKDNQEIITGQFGLFSPFDIRAYLRSPATDTLVVELMRRRLGGSPDYFDPIARITLAPGENVPSRPDGVVVLDDNGNELDGECVEDQTCASVCPDDVLTLRVVDGAAGAEHLGVGVVMYAVE